MASEVNDAVPTSIAHLVGQKQVIAQVTTAMDAAFEDGSRFDHSLLVGPPGLGKSQLASVIAQEMATSFYELLGQAITSVADLNALLLSASDKSIVHIDESHQLDKFYQTVLYLALDKRTIFTTGKRSPQSIPIADFTLLLSTTDEYALLTPLARPDEADASLRVLHGGGTGPNGPPSVQSTGLGHGRGGFAPDCSAFSGHTTLCPQTACKAAVACAGAKGNTGSPWAIGSGLADWSKLTTLAWGRWNASIFRSCRRRSDSLERGCHDPRPANSHRSRSHRTISDSCRTHRQGQVGNAATYRERTGACTEPVNRKPKPS